MAMTWHTPSSTRIGKAGFWNLVSLSVEGRSEPQGAGLLLWWHGLQTARSLGVYFFVWGLVATVPAENVRHRTLAFSPASCLASNGEGLDYSVQLLLSILAWQPVLVVTVGRTYLWYLFACPKKNRQNFGFPQLQSLLSPDPKWKIKTGLGAVLSPLSGISSRTSAVHM